MFSQRNVRNFGAILCMILLLFVGKRAIAQQDQDSAKTETGVVGDAAPAASNSDIAPLPPEKLPPTSPTVEYSDQLLKIGAFNSTLADILARVSALTGANIDVPPNARGERMVVDLGPGPPRQILTSLLRDTDFDFVITSSKDDPDAVLTVLLTPRGHNTGSNSGTVVAEHPAVNIRRMSAERRQASDTTAENQAEDDSATSGSENAIAEAPATELSVDSSGGVASPVASNPAPARTAELPTGQTAQQSMNQQMLQLYKQREQQIQGQRALAHQANP